MPKYSARWAGTATAPSIGAPSMISPMHTANSSRPAANSRVPSSGSTSQKRGPGWVTRPAATSSSATTGISGVAARKPDVMSASA